MQKPLDKLHNDRRNRNKLISKNNTDNGKRRVSSAEKSTKVKTELIMVIVNEYQSIRLCSLPKDETILEEFSFFTLTKKSKEIF